jgi:hypothetical protein
VLSEVKNLGFKTAKVMARWSYDVIYSGII